MGNLAVLFLENCSYGYTIEIVAAALEQTRPASLRSVEFLHIGLQDAIFWPPLR